MVLVRIMRCEDQQIPASGAPGRLRGGLPGPPRVSAQVQPQEVHPAAAPGLPGAQGVRAPRLPRAGRASADHPDLAGLIGLKAVPHYTTFQKAAQRLLAATPGRRMFDAVLRRALKDRVRKRRVPPGGRRRHGPGVAPRQPLLHEASGRREARRRQDLRPLPEGRLRGRLRQPHDPRGGPRSGAGDRPGAVRPGLQLRRSRRARIEVLLADADFDAEWLHKAVRSHGVRTIIPPTRGRPSDKPPAGRWRRVMKQRFARLKPKYGQRWQVETVNSMIKRRLGSALRAGRGEPVPRDRPAGHHA